MDKDNPNNIIYYISDIFIKSLKKNNEIFTKFDNFQIINPTIYYFYNKNQNDAWDEAINDDKFYINNKIIRIFPVLKNTQNYSKLKIDETSFSYITIREIAEIISKIVSYHLLLYNLNPQKITIIDYTAGVGGNVLSFSKFFYTVYAIEISKLRAEYLENNVNIYGFKNIIIINDSAITFNEEKMIDINPNVIFIDPPWGGICYKNNESLLLSLGSLTIEELVMDIIKKFSNLYLNKKNSGEEYDNYNNKFIVLKLPKNYDIEFFYNFISKNCIFVNYKIKTYLYILNKMIIIVCEIIYVET